MPKLVRSALDMKAKCVRLAASDIPGTDGPTVANAFLSAIMTLAKDGLAAAIDCEEAGRGVPAATILSPVYGILGQIFVASDDYDLRPRKLVETSGGYCAGDPITEDEEQAATQEVKAVKEKSRERRIRERFVILETEGEKIQ